MLEHFERKELGGLGTYSSKDFLVAAAILVLCLNTREAVAQQVSPVDAAVQASAAVSEADPFKRVQEIEMAMTAFKNDILPKLDLYAENPEMREKIRAAFKAFDDNLKNPWRANQEAKDVLVKRPNGFSYCFDLEKDSKSMMLFTPFTRQLHLPPDIDVSDSGVRIFLLHELTHVVQDDECRKSIPWERYIQYAQTGGDFVFVPEHEAQAIALQIEVANIVTRGALKKAAKRYSDNLPLISRDLDSDKWLKKYVAPHLTKNETDFVGFVRKRYGRVPGIKIFKPDLTPGE